MQQSLVFGFGSLVLALPSAASGLAPSGMEPQADKSFEPDPTEELITKSYQLGGFQHFYAEPEGNVWLLPISQAGLHGSVNLSEPAGEAIINLFSNTYWKELEFDGRWLEYDEAYRVSLRGTQEMHDNFEAIIAFYARQMASTVPLQVDIVRYNRGPVPQYLQSAEAADAWIDAQRSNGLVQSLVLTVPYASLGSFQQQSVQTVLAEVDAEIAEGVALAEGRPSEVRSGTWGVFAVQSAQGGLELDLQWMRSEAPRLREHKLELVTLVGGGDGTVDTLDLGGVLELTDQRAVAVGTSVFLPDGQVLLSHFIDGEQSQGTCVAIRRLSAPEAPKWLSTTGRMKAKLFMTAKAPFQSREFGWNHEDLDEDYPFSYGAQDGRSYMQLFRGESNAIELLLADRNENMVEVWDDWGQVLMRTNSYEGASYDAQVSEIDRLALRLTHPTPAKKNYRIELQVRGPKPGNEGVLVQQNHVVQAGGVLNMMLVNEHAELHTHNIQIASRAGIYEPATRLVLEGLIADLQLQRIGEDDLRVHFNGSYQWPVGERRIDLDSRWFAPYTQKEYGRADFQESRMLQRSEEGVWQAAWGGQGEGMVLVTLKIHEL